MKTNNCFIINTSPLTQSSKNPRRTTSLNHHQRHLHGKPQRNNAVKELDTETGLYYFGARYLDPKASRWISGDPALGEYLPSAPVNEEARKRNGNLPGMGGVFNYVNLHVYHYAGNNPVKLVDPDGRDSIWNIDEQTKTIEIIIPVKFSEGTTAEQRQEFYDAAKNWEGTFTINTGLSRGNLNDTTGTYTYTVTVNVVEIESNGKYEGININTVTFLNLQRDDNNGLIPEVKHNSREMILYNEYNINPVLTHEIGHLFGLADRYYERKNSSGDRRTPAHYGWESNIMGNAYIGSVDGRNFDEGLLRSVNRRVYK